eukprot:4616874-Pyramimonas_sp.AAC.1
MGVMITTRGASWSSCRQSRAWPSSVRRSVPERTSKDEDVLSPRRSSAVETSAGLNISKARASFRAFSL